MKLFGTSTASIDACQHVPEWLTINKMHLPRVMGTIYHLGIAALLRCDDGSFAAVVERVDQAR